MLKIIIADDEKLNQTIFSKIFKGTNSVILYADDGKQVIDLIERFSDIDLIFMDIQMPLINGLDATKAIREFNKDVVIIAQTAFAYTYDKDFTQKQGCNDFINKPFTGKTILEVVKKHIPEKVDDLEK
ncbi:MAG: response regulator [Bacteroidota bacterium]|nr:response regulator [Bacteroidota bacterium]